MRPIRLNCGHWLSIQAAYLRRMHYCARPDSSSTMLELTRTPGLLLKLAVFFLACGVPGLFALDAARTALAFRQIVQMFDSQEIVDEIKREASAIGRHRRERGLSGIGLERDLERWLLTLQQPNRSPFGTKAFALLDYAPQPFVAMLVDAEGMPLASTREGFTLPRALPPDSNRLNRLYRAELQGPDGALETLVLWVDLPRPGERIWHSLGLDWPIVFAGALVFAVMAAVFLSAWVTRRLRRIEATANAWRHGRFELRIADAGRDEIGALARQLDTLPAALAELVEHRAERAGRAERERIARDLHDTIKQQAFALSMQLGALGSRASSAHVDLPELDEARSLTAHIQQELATLLDELHPLPPIDWHTRLLARITAWSRRSAIAADIALEATESIAPARHDLLGRFIDEALANVERHSGATRVAVRLTRSARHHLLEVADNGRGGIIDGHGRGLRHFRERATELPEGQFDWHSDAASGSRVALRWTETVT